MNVNLNFFSNSALSFFRESVLPSLTARHKKILVVVSLAFGLLAACLAINRWCLTSDRKVKQSKDKARGLEGQETKTNSDGDLLTGKFINGLLNGQGKIIRSNGRGILEGEFKDNKLCGQGKKTDADGDKYEGEFKDNKLNGQGRVVFDRGSQWIGEFKDDLLHGQGTAIDRNGEVAEGMFLYGVLHGQGKKTYPDGTKEEGEFRNKYLFGQGKRTYSDGEVEEGIFEANKLIKPKTHLM
jgi:hypothetical protein